MRGYRCGLQSGYSLKSQLLGFMMNLQTISRSQEIRYTIIFSLMSLEEYYSSTVKLEVREMDFEYLSARPTL